MTPPKNFERESCFLFGVKIFVLRFPCAVLGCSFIATIVLYQYRTQSITRCYTITRKVSTTNIPASPLSLNRGGGGGGGGGVGLQGVLVLLGIL